MVDRRLLVLLGTRKGAFILETNASGREARGSGASGTALRGLADQPRLPRQRNRRPLRRRREPVVRAAVWRSDDLGATWMHSSAGLTYGDADRSSAPFGI